MAHWFLCIIDPGEFVNVTSHPEKQVIYLIMTWSDKVTWKDNLVHLLFVCSLSVTYVLSKAISSYISAPPSPLKNIMAYTSREERYEIVNTLQAHNAEWINLRNEYCIPIIKQSSLLQKHLVQLHFGKRIKHKTCANEHCQNKVQRVISPIYRLQHVSQLKK